MKKPIHKINWGLWYLFLLLLPITSLPLTSKLLQSTMVAAPSILIMGLLLVFWMTPFLTKKGNIFIPKPLLLFLCFAIFSSLSAFFINIPIQKNLTIFKTGTEGITTLIIGLGFYILISNFIRTEKILGTSIRIIAYSMIPVFIWSGMQLGSWMIIGSYPEFMGQVQSLISTSGNLYQGRITGFAFEPSWFAHMLTILYIPLWLGLTLQNISVFQRKIYKISFENILLILSIVFLFYSKSRIGLISLAGMLIFLFVKIHAYLVTCLKKTIIRNLNIDPSNILVSTALITLYLISIFGSIFIFSKFDKRMENLLNPATYQNQRIASIANEFQFAERIMYWQAGWRVFNDYPLAGVGLGNAGYFFEEKLPAFAWALDEPRTIFYRADYLPNNKNLWTKLLSETGILGFSTFVVWLIVIWSQSNILKRHPSKLNQGIGYAGLFALISFVVEGFSIDSFALPYYWFIPGLISAVFLHLYLSPHKSESAKLAD